ncbi:MAG: hypothetical protein NC244_07665 [Alistipes senegalensis]|nr:hypothetical protein [Alistipes senegalensis]
MGAMIPDVEISWNSRTQEHFNVALMFETWIGTVLYAVPCFALVGVLKNQEEIKSDMFRMRSTPLLNPKHNNTNFNISNVSKENNKDSVEEYSSEKELEEENLEREKRKIELARQEQIAVGKRKNKIAILGIMILSIATGVTIFLIILKVFDLM